MLPSSSSRRSAPAATLVAAAALLLSACDGSMGPGSVASPNPSTEHGIEAGGAVEVAAPALALVTADESGAMTLLDLATEERTALGAGDGHAQGLFGDGRRVYLARDAGARTTVEIVDTGRWTVPHGDHTHSFLAEPRRIGTVEGDGRVTVRAGDLRAVVEFDDAGSLLLDPDALDAENFEVPEPLALTAAAGALLPFAGHLLVPTADATVEVRGLDGATTVAAAAPCGRPTDADVTRVGAVVACAEGAVLFARRVGGEITAEQIPSPAGAAPATALAGRADRPDLAGVAGDRGAWLLDVRERRWTLLRTDVPLLRAVAVGDDEGRTVAVDADGRVQVLGPDGAVLARTEPVLAASVADPMLRDRVQLLVDARHAYVTDPAAGAVHEIAHDGGRITRTFADLDPWFLQQVG